MTEFDVFRVDRPWPVEAAIAVRRAVFVEEQGVPEGIELDGEDSEAVHFLATAAEEPVGTARLRFPDAETAKAERVAVLADHRGQGLGSELMACVESEARDRNCSRLVVHAQTAVEPFYDSLGYRVASDEFLEAGIPHAEMRKII